MKRIIKTLVKTKINEKTREVDKHIYENAFNTAVIIHSVSDVFFKEELNTMNHIELTELKNYLVHDKTTKDKKVKKMPEYLPSFKILEVAMVKIATAMDCFKKCPLKTLRAFLLMMMGLSKYLQLLEPLS